MGPSVRTVSELQVPSSLRREAAPGHRSKLAQMDAGLDIALAYFNTPGNEECSQLPELSQRAKAWADDYFGAYRYAAKRATGLLGQFPGLFNVDLQAHMRLAQKNIDMASPVGTTPCLGRVRGRATVMVPVYNRDLLRAERRAQHSEPFPDFTEPTLLSDQEMDHLVATRTQHHGPGLMPTVDAAALRDSGLLHFVPEFIGQLACANLDDETKRAAASRARSYPIGDGDNNNNSDEEKAASFVVKSQRLRHTRRVILPGDKPVGIPGFHDDNEQILDDIFSQVPRTSLGQKRKVNSDDGDNDSDSGNETDASTSTAATRRANLHKQKAMRLSGASSSQREAGTGGHEEARPNKIRCNAYYPPPTLTAFDTAKGRMVTRINPAIKPEDGPDPWEELTRMRRKMGHEKLMDCSVSLSGSIADADDGDGNGGDRDRDRDRDDGDEQDAKNGSPLPLPTRSAASSTSRIIKIRIPKPSNSNKNKATQSKNPFSGGSTPSRVITLRDPRSASPHPADRCSAGSSVNTVIKLRIAPSPPRPATVADIARPYSSHNPIATTAPSASYRPAPVQQLTPPLSDVPDSGPASPASSLASPFDSIMGNDSLSSMSSVSIRSSLAGARPPAGGGGSSGGRIDAANTQQQQQQQQQCIEAVAGRARVRIKLVKRPSTEPQGDYASLKRQPKRAIDEVEGAGEREEDEVASCRGVRQRLK